MVCKNCKSKPVIKLPNSHVSLCKKCFNKYFEKKARKTIRVHNLIDKKENIGVACSGGKDSLTALFLLNKILKPRKQKLTVIAIDEGIKSYRNLSYLKKFCKENKLKLKIFSFKKEFGLTLDKIIKILKEKPCSICGVLRRYLLNKKAKELNLDKLATGHNLDDESQSILMNQFRSDVKTSARLGPMTGIIKYPGFVRRIKPLYFLTEKETTSFAFLNKLLDKFKECPYERESYRSHVRDFLNDFDAKFPGTKHSIINSFLEVLPLLKKAYNVKGIRSCKNCGEPCSGEICQACELLNKLPLNSRKL